ncbi:uncharacterized protein [Mytilus edulis]|uniref:uncharacterized protein n=1 Tax=Mytilus edulis TaxID=6550 RepID=UPI0039F0F318
MYNKRKKNLPVLPKTVDQINIDGIWTRTTKGDPFLQADDNTEGRMLIFSTQKNLTHLSAADIIYGDGTFYTCPSLFFQLYTFHAMVDGAMYPLVHSLLPAKSELVYTRFLTLLKDLCHQHQLQLQPNTIFLDYEVAIRNAAYSVFPGINAKGCFFHYTQCIWRKAQETGLQVPYKNDDNIHQLVRRAAVLPLIPFAEVEDVWFNALTDIDQIDTNTNYTAFTDYVTTYLVEQNSHLWNHYLTQGPRTTNHLEGWHSKLKKHVTHAHPNIFELIKLLKHEEAFNAMTMIQYAGGKRAAPKKKYVEINLRLDELKVRHRNQEVTTIEFGDAASHLLHVE